MEDVTLEPFAVEVLNEEQSAKYDSWLRAKVKESLDNPGLCVPNDVVITSLRDLIAKDEENN